MEILLFGKIILILTTVASAVQFHSDESFCCRYASMNEDCHDTCLEMFKTNDSIYLEKLRTHFPTNCPQSSPDLEQLWNCISWSNDTTEAWAGRSCCESAVMDQCRSACLQSHSREGIVTDCITDYEEALYDCVFKQQSKQKCCGRRSGVTGSCKRRCDLAFKSESGPTSSDIDYITTSCDQVMASCMTNFTNALRTKSIESLHCCSQATESECATACQEILRTETKDREIVTKLIGACGQVMPHKPMWKCFMNNPKPPPPNGTKVQCCRRAQSHECKQLCTKLYGNPWPEPAVWNQFEQKCQHNTDEIELQHCLVDEPCRMGCSGMTFCSNFNNRPTQLFRSCNMESDDMARDYFHAWSSGTIYLPSVNIPVKDIQTCEPDKWKAVACALQVKPCSSKTGDSIICKEDCLSLLNKCADTSRFVGKMAVEDLCETFSPSHLQSNCISLSSYTKPGNSQHKAKTEVTQPCHPNPCPHGHVCVINRKLCENTQSCPKFNCLPGCIMGYGSEFVVNYGALVKVPDSSRGEGCFKSYICSTSGSLRPDVDLPCTDERKACKLAGQIRSHATNFYVDCNFCSCYGGVVTCTNRQCPSSQEQKRVYTGMACNCPAMYSPVCGSNGRTYPSPCVAICHGQSEESITQGSCPDKDPCQSNPCKHKQRCVPTFRVCLTKFGKCQQYECLPKRKQCTRLLKSAIPLFVGKTYKHRRRYYDEQNILSSSHFFSNNALVTNDSTVCDRNNQEFGNICKLTRSKRRNLAYTGYCKASCDKRYGQVVCGQDRVTYNHSCMAEANGVFVDHLGACKSVKVDKDLKKGCGNVACPSLTNSDCKTVLPPGSCCPLCGGMMRVLINKANLNVIHKTSWNGPVTMRDIIWLLRRQLHVLECQIYGYLTTEGDMAILIVSTITNPTLIQEEACTREAERISILINNRSPLLTSYLILSPLTAATVSPSRAGGGASSLTISLSSFIFVTILPFFVHHHIT